MDIPAENIRHGYWKTVGKSKKSGSNIREKYILFYGNNIKGD